MNLLVPVATMAAMAIAIAVILGYLSKIFTVEGEATIKIKNDSNILVLPFGSNLMQSLKNAGYDLFAQCGGKGTCATCRVKIHDGLTPDKRTGAMLGPLSDKLKKEDWVLSCQVSPMNDMEIELFKPLVMSWPKVSAQPAADIAVAESQVKLSPAAARLRRALPGFDCDACGFPTCEEFAEALLAGKAQANGCLPGGRPVHQRVVAALESATGSASAKS